MSVANSAFLLAFVTTPIDSAPTLCIMHVGLVLSARARNKHYELAKVVNKASGILLYLAAIYPQTGMQS